MTWEIILTVVFAILTIVGIFVSYYFYVKNKITKAIAGEIDNAEVDDVEGPKKKAEVIAQLQTLMTCLKVWVSIIIQKVKTGLICWKKCMRVRDALTESGTMRLTARKSRKKRLWKTIT